MNRTASASLSPWWRSFGRRAARAPVPARFPFPLLRGLAVSLLLHGLLAIAWLAGRDLLPAPTPPPPDRLLVDLLGMVSDRQVLARQAAAAPPAPPTQAPTATPHRPRSWRAPVEATDAVPAGEVVETAVPPAAGSTPPALDASSPVMDTAGTQARQTVRPPEADPAAIRRYLETLRAAIQQHLVYPPDARSAGHVGSPIIRFTLTERGEILPGSLRVYQGCGHAELDENALQAAQASAPLQPPPHRMDVMLAVSFAQAP